MGIKYSQTEEARDKYFASCPRIFVYMVDKTSYDPNHVFTKEELCAVTAWSERAVRNALEKMANYYPVVSFSSTRGYRYMAFNENTSLDDLKQKVSETEHALAEIQSRIEALQARMKPLIAFKVKAQERIQELESLS